MKCVDAERFFNEPEKCLQIYKEVAEIYQGNLLPKSEGENWVIPKRNYYSNMFLTAMRNALYLLKEKGDREAILELCQKVLSIDIYDEYFNYEMINTYIELERNEDALRHYNYITKLYYSKLGVQIDEEIRNLYGKILSLQYRKVLRLKVAVKVRSYVNLVYLKRYIILSLDVLKGLAVLCLWRL